MGAGAQRAIWSGVWALALLLLTGCTVPGQGGSQATPGLTVAPQRVLIDERFDARATGLRPHETVTLSAAYSDPLADHWKAEGTFRADARGDVDLASDAPLTGSYTGVDAMGLVWSASSPGGVADSVGASGIGLYRPSTLVLSLRAGKRVLAIARVQRYLMTTAIHSSAVRAGGLFGQFYRPAANGRVPAVLVFGGSEGGLYPYVMREAALLAAHGYAALALAYFGEPGLPQQLVGVPLEYFGRAIAWMQRQPSVDGTRLAIMGTSRGGEAALLVASHYRQLRAVVSYSGSGLVFPAPADPTQAAWTWHGRGVAWARSAATVRQAEIPVERINGPVLLICGKDDRLWPSGTLLQVAVRRLQAHGRPYRYLCYPSAGHLIQPPYLPTQSTIDSRFGGDPKGQEAADTDSWSRVLALLRSAL